MTIGKSLSKPHTNVTAVNYTLPDFGHLSSYCVLDWKLTLKLSPPLISDHKERPSTNQCSWPPSKIPTSQVQLQLLHTWQSAKKTGSLAWDSVTVVD